MRTYEAGTRVNQGYYFSGRSWRLAPVAVDGDVLPGASGERFLRIPLLLAFGLAPLMGAAFLMFLPVIGFYLTAQALTRPVVGLFRRSSTEVAATMVPVWVPGQAHLVGQPAEEEEPAAGPPADERLDSLKDEIAARRQA